MRSKRYFEKAIRILEEFEKVRLSYMPGGKVRSRLADILKELIDRLDTFISQYRSEAGIEGGEEEERYKFITRWFSEVYDEEGRKLFSELNSLVMHMGVDARTRQILSGVVEKVRKISSDISLLRRKRTSGRVRTLFGEVVDYESKLGEEIDRIFNEIVDVQNKLKEAYKVVTGERK